MGRSPSGCDRLTRRSRREWTDVPHSQPCQDAALSGYNDEEVRYVASCPVIPPADSTMHGLRCTEARAFAGTSDGGQVMRPNKLRRMHRDKQPMVNAWLSIPSAYASEVACHTGVDAATVDCQHGMVGFADAIAMFQAIATTDAVPMVRPSANDPAQIMRFLDAGAYGVICPMISTAAQAAQLVSACRYPPAGSRSFGPARGALYGGPDYFDRANEEILVLAMIETREALANLDAILATPGLDGIYVGPNDLAIELGHVPKAEHDHPDVTGAVERIAAEVIARGLLAGIFCSDGKAAQMRLRQGFHLVTPGNDAAVFRAAYSANVRQAREAT